MHQWRNWQTRTLQARMGDRVGSSPTWCTSRKLNSSTELFFYCIFRILGG